MFEILSTCKGGGYHYCRTSPPHPKANSKGLYPLHRVVMENKIGRLLLPNEDVHHKDEDKSNDSPENLELLTNSDHARLHGIRESIKLVCPICSEPFELLPYQLKQRQKTNKDRVPCCSRRCGGISSHKK